MSEDDDTAWLLLPSRRAVEPPLEGALPAVLELVLDREIYIDRSQLPPGLVNRLLRLAAFQNPMFYAAQAVCTPMRGFGSFTAAAHFSTAHDELRDHYRYRRELTETVPLSERWRQFLGRWGALWVALRAGCRSDVTCRGLTRPAHRLHSEF